MNISTSPLVQAVTAARRPTSLPVAWLVTIVLGIFVLSPAAQTAAFVLLGDPDEGSAARQVVDTAGFAATLAVLALWVVFKEERPFASVGFLGRGAGRFFAGVLGGAVLFAVPTLALVVSGTYAFASADARTGTAAATALAFTAIVPAWIVQATTEEAVVRGYLLQWHGLKQPAWAAVLITSAGFAALHLEADPLVLSNIFLVGLFFSFVSLAQGSIWLVAGIHAGWNMTQGNVFGVPVSGMPVPVSLLPLSPAPGAHEWLTGGSFGIEGSAATTLVLAAAAALAYRYYRRTETARLTR